MTLVLTIPDQLLSPLALPGPHGERRALGMPALEGCREARAVTAVVVEHKPPVPRLISAGNEGGIHGAGFLPLRLASLGPWKLRNGICGESGQFSLTCRRECPQQFNAGED